MCKYYGALLGLVSVLQGSLVARGAPGFEPEPTRGFGVTEYVILASFFWPCPNEVTANELIAPYDRCHLWDGYCTSGPILACDRREKVFAHRWAPSRPGARCCPPSMGSCGARAATGASGPAWTTAPALRPESDPLPTPAENFPAENKDDVPVPSMKPSENTIPRNIIPTSGRESKSGGSRTVNSEIVRAARAEPNAAMAVPQAVTSVPPTESPNAPQVSLSLAPNPPEPQSYDYHLPRSLREAVRCADATPLGAQLQQLGQTTVR